MSIYIYIPQTQNLWNYPCTLIKFAHIINTLLLYVIYIYIYIYIRKEEEEEEEERETYVVTTLYEKVNNAATIGEVEKFRNKRK